MQEGSLLSKILKFIVKYDKIYTINTKEAIVMMIRPHSPLHQTLHLYNIIDCVSSFVKLMKLLIFIDNVFIDYCYIDTHITDITF